MKKYIAEFIGTMFLVLLGCGTAVASGILISAMGMLPAAFTTVTTALAFGMTLAALCYAIGSVSGCHVNPAVSLAMLIRGRMTAKDFIGYIIAQFAGGIAGAGLLAVIIGGTMSLGANGYGSLSTFSTAPGAAFLVELLLTFIFVMVVLGATAKDENKAVSGIAIGFALTMVHLFGIPFTGTSVNPARSFGPALLQGGEALPQVWLFIAAPLAGGALAALVYGYLTKEPKQAVSFEAEAAEDDAQEADDEALAAEEADETLSEAETLPEITPSER